MKNVNDKALLPVAMGIVNGRIRSGGVIRGFRRRRILREDDEGGATSANTTVAAGGAGHPSTDTGSLEATEVGLVDHESGQNDGLKNPQTDLQCVLQVVRNCEKVDGAGGARARGDKDVEARDGASLLQEGNGLRVRTNVGSFEQENGLGVCNGRAEAGLVIGMSTDSVGGIGRAEDERAKGFEERQAVSCRGRSTDDSFPSNENGVGLEDVSFSRERGTLEGQEGNTRRSLPRQSISATREDQMELTSAQTQRVHREFPSVEGGRLAGDVDLEEEREILTGNEGVESNEEPAIGGRASPKQDIQAFEAADAGGELPENKLIREVCDAHNSSEHKGGDGASSAGEPVNHDHALPTPVLPKPQLLRFPVRRTRRPLTPKSDLLVGETANELLREYGESPPGGSGTRRDEQYVEVTRERYHEQLDGGCTQGDISSDGPTGVPDEPLVDPGHEGGAGDRSRGGGDDGTVSPEGVFRTPSVNRVRGQI